MQLPVVSGSKQSGGDAAGGSAFPRRCEHRSLAQSRRSPFSTRRSEASTDQLLVLAAAIDAGHGLRCGKSRFLYA